MVEPVGLAGVALAIALLCACSVVNLNLVDLADEAQSVLMGQAQGSESCHESGLSSGRLRYGSGRCCVSRGMLENFRFQSSPHTAFAEPRNQ